MTAPIQSPFSECSTLINARLQRPLWQLGAWIVVCFAAAGLGAAFAPDEWFDSLIKPSFQPPAWLFGPVWSVLYLLLGCAIWLVNTQLRAPRKLRQSARQLFLAQLALNALWTPLFFGAHQIGLALLTIVVLDVAVIATIRRFARVERRAAWLLAPYLLWLSFATVLNASLWWLNP
jgi:translocator protein